VPLSLIRKGRRMQVTVPRQCALLGQGLILRGIG
jgi:hypothetical protein